ncbi:MAG: hypothetical protein IT515_18465 [Burkholderiales bacterium]|nr:hypothetical protein [Burkholderiales bacterium]
MLALKWLSISAFAVAVTAGAPAALAADDHKQDKKGAHKHDEKTHAGHHGGVVAMAGHTEYELVAKPDVLTIYVSEEEKPVSTKGASGTLTLLGKDKASATLVPAGDNRLEAKGAFKLAPGTRVVATITLQGHKPDQVRFTLK